MTNKEVLALIVACVATSLAPMNGFWWNTLLFVGTFNLALDAIVSADKERT